ncbi:MAG TPA: hypothetical protein VM261_09440 [Kofleriaceae bacterium]|nr:hypothetical protein [Kofleriaceae bacterium]
MSLIVSSMSCQNVVGAPPPTLALDDHDTRVSSEEARALRSSCELAQARCSRCHTLDRVVLHEAASPRHWQDQVQRMRRIAGSTISRPDGAAITRCLVYRSFGPDGLEALPDAAGQGVAR